MSWTEQRPTAPGAYWMRKPDGDVKPVEVATFPGGLRIFYPGVQYPPALSLDMFDPGKGFAWAGPIEPPPLPSL